MMHIIKIPQDIGKVFYTISYECGVCGWYQDYRHIVGTTRYAICEKCGVKNAMGTLWIVYPTNKISEN